MKKSMLEGESGVSTKKGTGCADEEDASEVLGLDGLNHGRSDILGCQLLLEGGNLLRRRLVKVPDELRILGQLRMGLDGMREEKGVI